METNQVLEKMFERYRQVSLEQLASARDGKDICVEGYVTDYLDEPDGFFMSFSKNLEEKGEDLTLKYIPRIGISIQKMKKICEKISKINPKLKVYGQIVQENQSGDYKELEVHAIEFEIREKKFTYPNARIIDGDDKETPIHYAKMDEIDYQKVEKEFYRIHSVLDTLEEKIDASEKKKKIEKILEWHEAPKTKQGELISKISDTYLEGNLSNDSYLVFKNDLQKAEAELEFYKRFDEFRYNYEKKLRENTPEIIIIEGDVAKNIELGL